MKSFLSGRAHHDQASLASDAPPKTAAFIRPPHAGHAGAPDAPERQAPAVECIRQGDKVVRLVVTCSCGERIEIDCLYPAGG